MSRSSTPGGGPPQPWGFGDEKDHPAQYRSGRKPGQPAFRHQNYGAPLASSPRWRHRSRRGVWIALLVVVVLLALGGGAVVAYASMRTDAAVQAARRYCSALLADNYAAAYDTLSAGLQSRTSRDQFVADGKLHDQVDGRVTACAVRGAAGPLSSVSQIRSSTLTLDATLRRSITSTGAVTVAEQGSGWKVAGISSSLQGSDLAPLKAGQAFCASLVAGNYSAAYGLLSSGQQSQVSEQQFAAQFSDTFAGSPIKLTSCNLDLTSYVAGSQMAKVNALLTIQNLQASSGVLKVTLTMVREGGAWKIDDIHLTS